MTWHDAAFAALFALNALLWWWAGYRSGRRDAEKIKGVRRED